MMGAFCFVTPAQAGVQSKRVNSWVPACAGMTKEVHND